MSDIDDQHNPFSNLEEIKKVIQEGESGMMSVEQAQQIVDDEAARLKKLDEERRLDPLHVQTPMLQRMQREYPDLNSHAGTTNWALLASTALAIVKLRTAGVSSADIEREIMEIPFRIFKVIYKQGLVKKG